MSQFPPQEHENECCFVASRGPNRGLQCKKQCYVLSRDNYGRHAGERLPVCSSHVNKWEENYRAQNFADQNHHIMLEFILQAVEDAAAQQNMFVVPRADREERTFENIPAAIEISLECSVCSASEQRILLPCQHVICFTCFGKVGTSCPVCRTMIDTDLVKRLV